MGFKNYIWDEQFNLNVARGKVRGAKVINIFGFNAATTTNMRALWELADTTDYVFPTSAVNMTVTSDAADDGKTMIIFGLDANYEEIQELVTLNNATPPVTTLAFFRINNVVMISATNTANVSVTNGGVTYARIDAGRSTNQASIYTVPAGCEFYLYRIDAFMNDASAAKPGLFRNRVSFPNGRVLRVADTPYLNQMNIKRDFPFRYEEKTDIQLQVRTLSGTTYAGVFGEGIEIKEEMT
jgi:hypothetical protein